MKKIKNKNIFILVFYIIVLIYYIFIWFNYRYLQNGADNQKLMSDNYTICEKYLNSNEKEKINLKNKYEEIFSIDDENCESLVIEGSKPNSAFYIFQNFLYADNYLIPFFVPIIVILPMLFALSKEYSGKFVKSFCLRNEYKKYIKHIYTVAYKNILLVPIMILITFLISYILSGCNLDIRVDLIMNRALPNIRFINSVSFYFFYILILILNMGIYINIALTVINKNKKFIISLIESIICIFLLWAISEIGIGLLVSNLFNISNNNFNILNIYNWMEVSNPYIYLLYTIIVFVITGIISYLSCKNKEKFIIMCEK